MQLTGFFFKQQLFIIIWKINAFHATCLFLYLLKTPGNLWFSDVLRAY